MFCRGDKLQYARSSSELENDIANADYSEWVTYAIYAFAPWDVNVWLLYTMREQFCMWFCIYSTDIFGFILYYCCIKSFIL